MLGLSQACWLARWRRTSTEEKVTSGNNDEIRLYQADLRRGKCACRLRESEHGCKRRGVVNYDARRVLCFKPGLVDDLNSEEVAAFSHSVPASQATIHINETPSTCQLL